MRERTNRRAWRACVGQPTVGSNPTPSPRSSLFGTQTLECARRSFCTPQPRRVAGGRAEVLRCRATVQAAVPDRDDQVARVDGQRAGEVTGVGTLQQTTVGEVPGMS